MDAAVPLKTTAPNTTALNDRATAPGVAAQRWEAIYAQVPLCEVPRHFAGIQASPFLLHYLAAVLRLCPRGGRTLETGVGSGYGAVWLSLRGCRAEGIDYSPPLVERARQVNGLLGGAAAFRPGDLFGLRDSFQSQGLSRYDVVHHQGVLEHFTVPQIRAALAQQVACARRVVFSVPSVHYPFEPEFGDERLLPLEEWARVLAPFDVESLDYYGDPALGGQEHVLAVLRGQEADGALLSLMDPGPEPYPAGISAIVHTRNEARHIGPCLETLRGWTDEIIVCDMESQDGTLAIARQYTDNVVAHPLIADFDRARNVSAMRAKYRWVFYLDADERVPEELGRRLRALFMGGGPGAGDALTDPVPAFEGLLVPFRHHFAGRWMRSLYPGYTAPRLLKNGRFVFNARHHSGAQVDGRVVCFPADDPALALEHYSFDSLSHYLEKLNRYTDGEALGLHRDGRSFHWREAVGHFVRDFRDYYERGEATRDGVHGFLYSFLSGFYRFEQHAKLYERRAQSGQLQAFECEVPGSVEEVLEYALGVARHRPAPSPAAIPMETAPVETSPVETAPLGAVISNDAEAARADGPVSVVLSGPLLDPSGYGEESRHLLRALDLTSRDCARRDGGNGDGGSRGGAPGISLTAQIVPWSHDEVDFEGGARERLRQLTETPARPGFTHIVHNFAPAFWRHPRAGLSIGRTMFETDRLPENWVAACNRMDHVWVPSAFNRETFARAGVDARKLAVVPGCLDPDEWLPGSERTAGERKGAALADAPGPVREIAALPGTVFLSVFDWTRHKGWDVLLAGFLEAFEGRGDAHLVLKVWSTNGHSEADIRRQASEFCREALGHDLAGDGRVRFVFERLTRAGLRALYGASDCYVLPSRGEGWGLPYLEAMACGLPVVGPGWGGNTAFMTAETSVLLGHKVVAVPEAGWREVAAYRGHRWAEPSRGDLIEALRRVSDDPAFGRALGACAREDVLSRFSEAAVGRLAAAELARAHEAARPHPVMADGGFMADSQPAAVTPGETEPHAENGKRPTPVPSSAQAPSSGPSQAPSFGPVSVRWEGPQLLWHSLAHVNRELCLALLESGQVDLSLVPTEPDQFSPDDQPRFAPVAARSFAPLPGPAQVHVRHFFPPRFEAPVEGHLVLIQPWEYGYLPADWVRPIEEQATEVWCYSRYVRDVYLRSGVPAHKLHVVPLGVDAETFCPEAPPFVFTDEPGAARLRENRPGDGQEALPAGEGAEEAAGPFVFLWVGGTIERKGIDVLLDAYVRAFSACDDVALVVKDTGTETVYRGQNARERVLGLAADPTRPRVVYLEEDLSAHRLAGVYTAADCLVAPYRGEGFFLPALEAMACGVPAIVPAGGPTDDFVDETVGWRVAAEHRPFGNGRVGEWQCVGPTWLFEVDPEVLARQMREVYGRRAEARRRGTAGAARVRSGWTWRHSAAAALGRLTALQQVPPRDPSRPSLPDPAAVPVPDLQSGVTPAPSDAGVPARLAADTGLPVNTVAPAGASPQEKRRRKGAGGRVAADAEAQGAVADPVGSSRPEMVAVPGPARRPTISLCMIVRDEERVLGDCLASVKPFVDEIVVVDTGSTDKTMEIAEEHGARLFRFPWVDDFSAARNESLAHATGDWVLWMDADDTLPAECGQQLHDLALLAEDKVTGLLMQVHIPPAPGEVGFTVVDHVKLLRNGLGLRFEGRIHEQILEPIYRLGGEVRRSGLHVVHSGYDHSPEGQRRKRARDLSLLEKDLADRPDHPFVLFNVGMTAFHQKEYEKARGALERCLSLSKPQESTVRKVYAMLAGCALEQGRLAEAGEWVKRGLSQFPRDPELLFRAGIVYRELGDLSAAAASYETLLTGREVGHIDSLDVSMTGFKAHHNLALIYQDQGRWAEAEGQWRAAVAAEPGFVPSWTGLGEMYLRLGRVEEAHRVAEVLGRLAPGGGDGILGRLPRPATAEHSL